MRIGILTAFSEMSDAYSLAKVVRDQIQMILDSGNEPVLFALENFSWDQQPYGLEVRAVLPVWAKVDYQDSADLSEEHQVLAGIVALLLQAQDDIPAWFTHDIIFQGWNLPLGIAVFHAAARMQARWFHWIHSVPGGRPKDYWRLPNNSRIVYPNYTDRTRVAECFRCTEDDIVVVPHSCDVRDAIGTMAAKICDPCGLLDAEIISVFPIPIDRMESKGTLQVVRVMRKLHELGRNVKLVIADANFDYEAHGDKVRQIADAAGEDFLRHILFTHTVPGFEKGAPAQFIRDLMQIANLFIFPTKNETFGFTLAEAALSGQLLVLNACLPMQYEIAGQTPLYFQFGSHFQTPHYDEGDEVFYEHVARRILFEFDRNSVIQAKTRFRQKYNRSAVWQQIENAIHAVMTLDVAA